jgi:hypothetical protein
MHIIDPKDGELVVVKKHLDPHTILDGHNIPNTPPNFIFYNNRENIEKRAKDGNKEEADNAEEEEDNAKGEQDDAGEERGTSLEAENARRFAAIPASLSKEARHQHEAAIKVLYLIGSLWQYKRIGKEDYLKVMNAFVNLYAQKKRMLLHISELLWSVANNNPV